MPQIKVSLQDNDYATLPDCWKLYHAFLGRYYQRVVDSEAGFAMMASYKCYDAWMIPLTKEEYDEFSTLRNRVFDVVFKVEIV